MFILASNSPRRKQIIALGGWPFRVQAAEVDERVQPGEAPAAYVLRLAEAKARAALRHVAAAERAQALLIAADTTVADGAQILGKPADPAQAVQMLTQLRGRTHYVYTGIAALRATDERLLSDCCATETPMRDYSDAEIQAYVDSGDPLDKAGAYAIQHAGFHPVEALRGCYANVVGLPVCHLWRLIQKMGAPTNGAPSAGVSAVSLAQGCQQMFAYHCPIYSQILG